MSDESPSSPIKNSDALSQITEDEAIIANTDDQDNASEGLLSTMAVINNKNEDNNDYDETDNSTIGVLLPDIVDNDVENDENLSISETTRTSTTTTDEVTTNFDQDSQSAANTSAAFLASHASLPDTLRPPSAPVVIPARHDEEQQDEPKSEEQSPHQHQQQKTTPPPPIRSSSSTSSDNSFSSMSYETCPICNESTSPESQQIHKKYPLLCSTPECHSSQSICSTCISTLASQAQENTLQTGSDGNEFRLGSDLSHKCPFCRNDYVVSVEEILMLRRAEMWRITLKDVKDTELNASQLREKYYWNGEMMSVLEEAEGRFRRDCLKLNKAGNKKKKNVPCYHRQTSQRSQFTMDTGMDTDGLENEIPIQVDDLDEAMEDARSAYNINFDSASEFVNKANQLRFRIRKEMDFMIFCGLERCMSEAEQRYVVSLMTGGLPIQLAQAADLLASISDMNTNRQGDFCIEGGDILSISTSQSIDDFESISGKRSQSAMSGVGSNMSITSRRSSSGATAGSHSIANATTQSRRSYMSGTSSSVGYARGGISASSATSRNPNNRRNNSRRGTAQNPKPTTQNWSSDYSNVLLISKWKKKFPLPVRMPRSFVLPLNFDPFSRWRCPFTFVDDDESASPTSPSSEDDDKIQSVNIEIVKDAFQKLNISRWSGNAYKEPVNPYYAESLKNILPKVDMQSGSVPEHVTMPWRRVVISGVRGIAARLGFQVGDVITHINGEAFEGNSEMLRQSMILAMKDAEKNGEAAATMRVVVNAEISVAEALRLRHDAANTALENEILV